MVNSFREEFRIKNFKLQHSAFEDFCISQWKWPGWLFGGYRMCTALYTAGWSIIALVDLISQGQVRALAYLTQWTFILTSVYHGWAAATCLYHLMTQKSYFQADSIQNSHDLSKKYARIEDTTDAVPESTDLKENQLNNKNKLFPGKEQETSFSQESANNANVTSSLAKEEEGTEETREDCEVRMCNSTTVLVNEEIPQQQPRHLCWVYKGQWVLLTLVSVSNVVITIIYFAFLYPWLLTFNYKPSAFDINFHAVFTFITLADMFIIHVPVRVYHCVYIVCYGIFYFLFSLVFWACDHEENILYPSILDWNKPGVSVLSTTAIIFVLMPTVQLMFYGLYRSRNYFSERNT